MVNLFIVFRAVIVLYDLFAHDRLDDIRSTVGVFGALFAEQFADCLPDQKNADGQRNNRRIDDRREERTEAKHEYRDDNDLHDVQNEVHQIVREEIGKFRYIVCHTNDNFTGGTVVEVVERERLQLIENILADVGNDAMPHPTQTSLLVKRNYNFRQSRKQKSSQRKEIQPIILVRDYCIDDELEQERGYHRRSYGDQHDNEYKDQQLFMRQSVAQKPLQVFDVDFILFDRFILKIGISLCHALMPPRPPET